jgi:hypothetical protein
LLFLLAIQMQKQFFFLHSSLFVLHPLHQLEMPCNAEHEAVARIAVLEAMGVGLPDIAEVADAKGDAFELEVQHERLPEAKGVARMGTEKVVPHPTL